MDFSQVNILHSAYQSSSVIQDIHPEDGMYRSGPQHYHTVGNSAIKIILNGLALSWTARVSRVLDLPCGHGRVGRHLRAAFPDAELFFCDIDRSGADFCAETFDGKPIYSEPDLTRVCLPSGLDLIWIGSLFTHVDGDRATAWLRYLCGHLAEHGLLVATFHGLFFPELVKTRKLLGGADWDKITQEFEATGYGYARYANPEMGDYGISLSKASKIMDIATSIPKTRVASYTERGWAGNHDVLILTKHDRLKPF